MHRSLCWLMLLLVLVCSTSPVEAQQAGQTYMPGFTVPPAPPPPPEPGGGFTLRESTLGYIDNARPMDQVMFRFDAGYHFLFANRAEFFYAQPQPLGPGLPIPESRIDYQDLTVAIEKTIGTCNSIFIEAPTRLINPTQNDNTAGLSDLSAGFKHAFIHSEACVATFQLRVYTPTGDADRGLGTRHVSLEPSLLGFLPLTERLGLGAEFRYWIPLGGTDFAGDVARYGLGFRYDLFQTASIRISPLLEFVGWYVVEGEESRLAAPGIIQAGEAGGTNILNAKGGVRIDFADRAGLYAGYGTALTTQEWYSDILRIEFRWLY